MKVERWNFGKGENVLFYITDDSNSVTITARVFTPIEGKFNSTLEQLEEEIYYFTVNFKVEGKYIIIFRENNVKKLIVIATIR